MVSFLVRLIGGAFDPLIDQVSHVGARLLRKLALFAVAAICALVVLIALTVAFELWIASKFGAIAGALAVAGVYLVVAAIAVVFALRKEPQVQVAGQAGAADPAAAAQTAAAAEQQVDELTAPLMEALARLGLRREQLAVLAGSSLAKRLGPLPLVGLALLGGFLLGRMWKSWRGLLSADAVTSVLDALGLFAGSDEAAPVDEEQEKAA